MSQQKWLVLASLYLDSGTQRFASARVRHPDYIYEGYALNWGAIDQSIPVPSGLPQVSDATVRLADVHRHWRDIFAHETPRRRLMDLKIVREGTSVAAGQLVYTGEVINATFGPGYVEISLADHMFAWKDELFPAMIIKEIYPEVEEKDEGGFLNVIFGQLQSAGEGMLPCPHVALFETGSPPVLVDRYGLACHRVFQVIDVFRRATRISGDAALSEWEVVDPTEYDVVEVAITAFGVPMRHTFLDFKVDQAGAEIRADANGIDFRGAWGSLPAVGYDDTTSPPTGTPQVLRNLIDHFINATYFIFAKAGQSQDIWDTDEIGALRQLFEDLLYVHDGAITQPMTAFEILGRMLPSGNLDLYQNRKGKLALGFTYAEDVDRPVFTMGKHILKESFYESLPDRIATQVVFRYLHCPVTETFFGKVVFDTDEQAVLGYDAFSPTERIPQVETEFFDMYFLRDPDVAQDIVERRMAYQSLGSFKQEFQLPVPPTLPDVEMAKLVGITHSQGIEAYINREAKIYGLTLDLDRMVYTVRTILRTPNVIVIPAPETERFRPLTWEDAGAPEHEVPPVNSSRSFIEEGTQAYANDADDYDDPLTATHIIVNSTRSLSDSVYFHLYDFPEPDPARTLVSVTVHVVFATLMGWETSPHYGEPSGVQTSVLIMNAYSNSETGPPVVLTGQIFESVQPDIPKTDFSVTFSAEQFNDTEYFNGLAANIHVRCRLWNHGLMDCTNTDMDIIKVVKDGDNAQYYFTGRDGPYAVVGSRVAVTDCTNPENNGNFIVTESNGSPFDYFVVVNAAAIDEDPTPVEAHALTDVLNHMYVYDCWEEFEYAG